MPEGESIAYFWQGEEALSNGDYIFHLTHRVDTLFHNASMFSTSIIENVSDAADMTLSPSTIWFS